MRLEMVHRSAWTSMLSRICDTWTRKNSREIHLHFTSLSAASATARINEYGGKVLRCIYSLDNKTMFMVVAEPEFALNEAFTNSAIEHEDDEGCPHEFEDGFCLDCGENIFDTSHAYGLEHDYNDMER